MIQNRQTQILCASSLPNDFVSSWLRSWRITQGNAAIWTCSLEFPETQPTKTDNADHDSITTNCRRLAYPGMHENPRASAELSLHSLTFVRTHSTPSQLYLPSPSEATAGDWWICGQRSWSLICVVYIRLVMDRNPTSCRGKKWRA